jgi:hypothetical protein
MDLLLLLLYKSPFLPNKQISLTIFSSVLSHLIFSSYSYFLFLTAKSMSYESKQQLAVFCAKTTSHVPQDTFLDYGLQAFCFG